MNEPVFEPFKTDYESGDRIPFEEMNRMAAVVNAFMAMRGEGGIEVFVTESNVVIDGSNVEGVAPDDSDPQTEN